MTNTTQLRAYSIEKITEFVANGGTFFYPIANEDKRINYLLGFKPEANNFTDVTSKGFHFNYPILPDFKGPSINRKIPPPPLLMSIALAPDVCPMSSS